MAFWKTGRESFLNCAEIAPGHRRGDIHPVGMEGLEPAQTPPGFKCPCIFEEGY